MFGFVRGHEKWGCESELHVHLVNVGQEHKKTGK